MKMRFEEQSVACSQQKETERSAGGWQSAEGIQSM
jgi:hypothetical protein